MTFFHWSPILVCSYAVTYVMKMFLDWLADPNGTPQTGLLLTLLYTLLFVSTSFLLVHFHFRCYLSGHNLRSGLVGLIFRKMLLLNSDSRVQNGSGVLTNLIADNIPRLEVALETSYTLLEVPLALIFSCIFLVSYLGASALLSVLVLVVLSPLSYCVSRSTRKYKVKFLELSDRRVKKTTEAVHGIKVCLLHPSETSQPSLSDYQNEWLGRTNERYDLCNSRKRAEELSHNCF